MTAHRYGYARVSTLEQDPQLQIDALHTAGVDQVLVDHACGALANRPQLAALLNKIQPGDTLVVWRLDRLGRSTPHLMQLVTDLGQRGIGFVSLTENIDTDTAVGRLLFHLLASLAGFERDLTRERTLAGLASARAQGRRGGRPTVMTPEKLAVARQMLAASTSKATIARTIGVARPTLYDHLAALVDA